MDSSYELKKIVIPEDVPETISDDLAINKFKSLFKLDIYYRDNYSLNINFQSKDASGNIINYFKTHNIQHHSTQQHNAQQHNAQQHNAQQHQPSNINYLIDIKKMKSNNFSLIKDEINIKHKIFNLEGLVYCKKEIWNNCFDISNNFLTPSENNVNYFFFTKFMMELRNYLFGSMHYVGRSFSDKQILIGNLANYYIQYLSQKMFGHPQLFELFKNLRNIKKKINSQLEDVIDNFSDIKKIDNLLNLIPPKIENTHVLSVPLKINKPDFNMAVFKDLNTFDNEVNFDTFWIIHILII